MSNINVVIRKKQYNSSADNGDGVIVFDVSTKKIYVGGEVFGIDTNIQNPSNNQILVYNAATSKWINGTPTGISVLNYDFTHSGLTVINTSTTSITFNANTRGSKMISVSADIGITFNVNNLSDNYLWIKNTSSSDIDVLINSVLLNNVACQNVYVPEDGITVASGHVCEIGIVCNSDGAFITARNDLSL